MSKSNFRILADENVERKAARYLDERGHDVELVVDILEPGVDDETVAEYAAETDRLILSADEDFLSGGHPTLFQEDGEMSAFDLAETVDAVAAVLSQEELEETAGTKLVADWL